MILRDEVKKVLAKHLHGLKHVLGEQPTEHLVGDLLNVVAAWQDEQAPIRAAYSADPYRVTDPYHGKEALVNALEHLHAGFSKLVDRVEAVEAQLGQLKTTQAAQTETLDEQGERLDAAYTRVRVLEETKWPAR